MPDTYRGEHVGFNEESADKYAQQCRAVVEQSGGVGVFIAESAMGCGGQVFFPPGYLKKCYDSVRSAGGVCIADEVRI
jgi:4-aminobutyrate aminotransferase-like enzyme